MVFLEKVSIYAILYIYMAVAVFCCNTKHVVFTRVCVCVKGATVEWRRLQSYFLTF